VDYASGFFVASSFIAARPVFHSKTMDPPCNREQLPRARLRKIVSARGAVIQAPDVDPRDPRPDGRDCPQDQAVSV
jgi:hypothetical protein